MHTTQGSLFILSRSTAGRRIFVLRIPLIGFGEHLQGDGFCGCGIFGNLRWGILGRLDIISFELDNIELFKFVGILCRQVDQSACRGQACDREVCWWQCGAVGQFESSKGERSVTGVWVSFAGRNLCHNWQSLSGVG